MGAASLGGAPAASEKGRAVDRVRRTPLIRPAVCPTDHDTNVHRLIKHMFVETPNDSRRDANVLDFWEFPVPRIKRD